jgi:hypothetical protein
MFSGHRTDVAILHGHLGVPCGVLDSFLQTFVHLDFATACCVKI